MDINLQSLLYFLLWAGLFVMMMRFGCGSHVFGHGHGGHGQHDHGGATHDPAGAPADEAKDPVCGMTVKTASAKTAAYRGQVFYFCSDACRGKFEAAPESYAKAAAPAHGEHRHGCC